MSHSHRYLEWLRPEANFLRFVMPAIPIHAAHYRYRMKFVSFLDPQTNLPIWFECGSKRVAVNGVFQRRSARARVISPRQFLPRQGTSMSHSRRYFWDGAVSRYLETRLDLGWSFIVVASQVKINRLTSATGHFQEARFSESCPAHVSVQGESRYCLNRVRAPLADTLS